MESTLAGKNVLVLGVANEDSIAWHVARGLSEAGAFVHLTYQMRFKSRVLQLLKSHPEVTVAGVYRCDLLQHNEVEELVAALPRPLHGVVHSIAWAPPETFAKAASEASAAELGQTLEVSAWTLLGVARALRPLLAPEASIVAMSYLGAQRVVPGYRLMGIAKAALEAVVRELACELGPSGTRVNAISAGPIRTLAAAAVPDFDRMLSRYREVAPLRTTIDADDVATLAGFLLGDGARRITGQVMFVDAGFSILGTTSS